MRLIHDTEAGKLLEQFRLIDLKFHDLHGLGITLEATCKFLPERLELGRGGCLRICSIPDDLYASCEYM